MFLIFSTEQLYIANKIRIHVNIVEAMKFISPISK